MNPIILTLLIVVLASSTFAQAPADNNYAYPTKLENLLHRTGVVITTSSLEVGGVEGKMFQAESNYLTISVRTEVISNDSKMEKVYGLALQMGHANERHSRTTYVD